MKGKAGAAGAAEPIFNEEDMCAAAINPLLEVVANQIPSKHSVQPALPHGDVDMPKEECPAPQATVGSKSETTVCRTLKKPILRLRLLETQTVTATLTCTKYGHYFLSSYDVASL